MSSNAEKLPEEKKHEGELIQLGLHKDIPFEQYLKSPGISKHGLDGINQSPAHYLAAKSEPYEPSQAMIVGSAFHTLTLEPEKFEKEFVIKKYKDFRTNEAKEWKKEMQEAGMNILTKEEYDNCQYMVEAIRNHPFAGPLCDPDSGRAEVSGYWIDNSKHLWEPDGLDPTFRLCKMRVDFINDAHQGLVDLKKAECAGMSKFARAVHNYRYHVQDAWYSDGFRMVKGGFNPKFFIFVVVEPVPPYGIGVYQLAAKDKRLGRQLYKRNIQRYHDCMTTGIWPNYPDEIRELELPKYAEYVDVY